ncbi:hypothetical protein FC976_18455 [Clostridium sporogenes]|uniref:hypothetical protein n=1 Tax=Clostridium sporogenes TaxID=1509 RepID=UPI0013D7BB3D|nr:hypothetical protein [Clostridium sporogenes]NFH34447.1 hypothetical protein [Clostridium sporogenes]NFH49132.1 hypothetical protein [Clostridium sporogenes]NFL21814.1 hypothetical protein [Clostridium sporogenes]NFN74081.1 hypothetical protein [Clostridium sporogenes]NFV23501.1 hypothetical protein [Clostridium sporogenes]
MKIYTNKVLLFKDGDLQHKAINFEIHPAPDWIKDTPLFELAKADGTLTVIESREQQVAAENGDLKKTGKNKDKDNTNEAETDEKNKDKKSK